MVSSRIGMEKLDVPLPLDIVPIAVVAVKSEPAVASSVVDVV